MEMKPHTILTSEGLWGMGSWPTQAAVKANDRWWEALLAAACYLGVEHFQQPKIKSKPLVWVFFLSLFFSSPPSDETISSEQQQSSLNGNNEKQVREVDTKVDPDSDDGAVC